MDKDLQNLKDSIDKLTKALTGKFGGASVRPTYANAKPKQGQQETDHVDEADEAFDELSKAVLHQRQVAQDSALTFSNLTKNMKTIFRPIDNLRDAFEDMKDKLADNTRGMSDDYRKLSADTFDAFKTIITQGKDFGAELSKMGNAQKQFVIALENASKAAAAVNEYDGKVGSASAAKAEKQKEYDAARGRMLAAETPKQQKSTSAEVKRIAEELEALDKTLKNETNERDKFNAALEASNGILKDGFTEMERLQAMGINLIGAMNKEEISTIKAEKLAGASAINLSNALKKANANVGAITNAAAAAGAAVPTAVLSRNSGIAKGLEEGIGAFIKQGVPQLVKDMQSRKYYGNDKAMGSEDLLNMNGMTEAERTDLIGKNQQAFRVAGGGDVNKPWEVGGLMKKQADLQKNLFGYAPDVANQKTADNMNSLITSGFKPTQDTLTTFNNNMRISASVLGQSPDVIKQFYDSLNDTGQMALMQQAYADKPEAERLDLIQKNNLALMAVNQKLGLTVDEMKTANQRAFNQKYQSLEQSIRKNIMGGMLLSNFNAKTGNNYTQSEFNLGENVDSQTALLADAKDDPQKLKEYQALIDKGNQVYTEVTADIAKTQQNAVIKQAQSGDFSQGRIPVSTALLPQLIAGMVGGTDIGALGEEGMRRQQRQAGLGVDPNKKPEDQAIAGQTMGTNALNVTVEALAAHTDKATGALDLLATAAMNVQSVFKTVAGNPLGGSVEGLAQAGFHWAETGFALKGLANFAGVGGGGTGGSGGLLSRLFGIGGAGAAEAGGGALLGRLAGPLGLVGYGAYKGYSAEQNSNADLAKNMGVATPTTKVMQDKLKNIAGQDGFLKGVLGDAVGGVFDSVAQNNPAALAMKGYSWLTGKDNGYTNFLKTHQNMASNGINSGIDWLKNKDLAKAGFVTPDDMKNKDGIIDKMMKEKMLGSMGYNGIDADDSLREMLANKSITPDDLVKHGMTPDDVKKIVAGMDADKAADLTVDYLKKIYNVLDDTKDIHEERNKQDMSNMTFAEQNAQSTASRKKALFDHAANIIAHPPSTPK